MEKTFETDRGRFLIRPYHTEDEQGVLLLWQKAFKESMPVRLWRWKYLKGPFKHKILLCLNEGGKALALYGGIPYRANLDGQAIEIIQLMDIMSHPDYRGAGLLLRTAKAFFDFYCRPEGVLLLYGFPGKYHFDLGQRYLGYKGLAGGIRFLTVQSRELARKAMRLGGRIRRIREIDTRFDRLWEKCSHDYPFSIIRDVGFVDWRFFQHPLEEYEIWCYHTYPLISMKAYAVFSIEGNKARIVDMFAPYSSKIICDFLSRMGAEFAERKIEVMEAWFPARHFLTKEAISVGFVPRSEPLGIIPTIRDFDHSPSFQWMSDNMFYTLSDGDLV